jgi:adsorption protein B
MTLLTVYGIDLLNQLTWFLSAGFVSLGVLFAVFGFDDLLLTLGFLLWDGVRHAFLIKSKRHLKESTLLQHPQLFTAILLPAWHEDAVVGDTLRSAMKRIRYHHFKFFVGVYQNDFKTMIEVTRCQTEHPQHIEVVVVPHDGPTTKSDCLNHVLMATDKFEQESGQTIGIYVLHDAEDIIAPFELLLFNAMMSHKDIVQIPVFPIRPRWWNLIAGHYLDEFAQLHLRDMRLREWATGFIPSAGVGTAFSRRVFDLAKKRPGGKVFNGDSLTEDYELPMALSRFQIQGAFVLTRVERDGLSQYTFPSEQDLSTWDRDLYGVQAVREAFPGHWWAAIKQKSRWIIGIALQGPDSLGWEGSWAQKYMYFRDRKALFCNLLGGLGYMLTLLLVGVWALRWLMSGDNQFPLKIQAQPWFISLLNINLTFMGLVIVERIVCTTQIYGFTQGCLSVPRLVVANVINFVASLRALWLYFVRYRQQQQAIPWEKTTHAHKPEP